MPAGVLPLIGAPLPHGFSLQAPSEFEDASQMLEWLILVESKLQPEKIIIGDFVQVRSMLRELQVSRQQCSVVIPGFFLINPDTSLALIIRGILISVSELSRR